MNDQELEKLAYQIADARLKQVEHDIKEFKKEYMDILSSCLGKLEDYTEREIKEELEDIVYNCTT